MALFLNGLHLLSLSSDESESSLSYEYDASCFLCFRCLFFLPRFILIDLLDLLIFDKSYLFDDESDDDGSGSGSLGK